MFILETIFLVILCVEQSFSLFICEVVTGIACSVNEFTGTITSNKLNLHYTRCITPKRVTNLRGPSTRHCAWTTQLLSNKSRNGGEPLATLVFDLTGPGFETLTSRTRADDVTAQAIWPV